MPGYRKKLIEVALPLEAINEGSKPETENPFLKGHPRAIHNWWARTPLSISRAILFAQLIDDPGDGLSPKDARKAREKLLDFVAKLATWEATTDEKIIGQAREMIKAQFKGEIPEFWDMFAGRASIPLEAQRLGLKVTSSDLNPVAITIQRALLEFPPKFKDHPPIHPDDGKSLLKRAEWKGASGIAEDIRWYGEWVRQRAAKKLEKLYPKGLKGEQIVAWLWARTIKCPNPACGAEMPLVKTFVLASKGTEKTWIEPKVIKTKKQVRFSITHGKTPPCVAAKVGRGAKFKCIICDSPVDEQHIKDEGMAGRMGVQLLATVGEGHRARLYYSPDEIETVECSPPKELHGIDAPLNSDPRAIWCVLYGLTTYDKLFTPRQLTALLSISELIQEAREKMLKDTNGEEEYVAAVTTYLACSLSRLTDYCCALATWNPTNENVRNLFQRQGIPMAWDFVESNPIFGKLSYAIACEWVASSLSAVPNDNNIARVVQLDARKAEIPFRTPPVISTDPPYYDNIGYADISDYFYIWLRIVLRYIDPQTFATVLTPKEPELIASPYRHNGSEEAAEKHFREGFSQVFGRLTNLVHDAVPVTVYYAFLQQEDVEGEDEAQRASTGWETMLEGLLDAGFQITGTWPVRTTKKARSVALGTNALASAVVLVARQRPVNAPMATRKEFLSALKKELPPAFSTLTQTNIAPVDLAQAAIGPGMAVFSRYSKVLEADGARMSIRTALSLINQILDEVLAEQEGEFDPETRWAVAFFEQFGMSEGSFGVAETLSKAKNTAVSGLVEAGIVKAKAGKVKLISREELPEGYDPAKDRRITIWEVTQHLIKTLETKGESGAAELLRKVGGLGETARTLAYRLYGICEKKKWAQDALGYNGLVVAWPEIQKLAQKTSGKPVQQEMEL
jgi:putative DNA methylase